MVGQSNVGAWVKSGSAPTESGRKKFRRQARGGGKKKARLNLINRAGPSPREDDSR